ncbi:MAG TPA: putative lipid II flippase FtsW [Acidimicrobiales bacterium]
MSSVATNHPAVRAAQARGDLDNRPVGLGTYLPLGAVVVALCFVGAVMVLSASSVQGLEDYGSTWGYFKRQILWLGAGTGALLVTLRIDYRWWARLRIPLLVTAIVLLGAVLIPGVGLARNGSSRWLGTSGFAFQPSEVAKLALLVYVADLLARRRRRLHDSHAVLWPVLMIFGLVGGLILLEPDLGTTIVAGAIVASLLWISGVPLRWMIGLGLAGGTGALVLGVAAGYRRARLLSFLDPWADPQNTGYQIVQSLVGIGSGGATGVGLGASRAKWGFLPNAHTDFIFAIIAEETGLLGALAVLTLFVAFGVLGVRAASMAPDLFGTLLAGGITTWIVVQAFVNIGAVIGVMPITGVPLPYVSFGGTSLVTMMATTGILLNIARQGRGEPHATRSRKSS